MTPLSEAWAVGAVAVGMARLPRTWQMASGSTMTATAALAAALAAGNRPVGAVALAVVITAVAVIGAPRRWWPATSIALAGAGAWAAAVALGVDRLPGLIASGAAPWIAFGGGAALVVGASEDGHQRTGRHRRRPPATPGLTLLFVPGLVIAVSAANALHAGWVLVAAAGVTALASMATGRAAAALAALAVSTAAAGFLPAAWLLASGAAVATGLGDAAGVAAFGLPGSVAVAVAVSHSGDPSRASLAVLAALGAAAAVALVRPGDLGSRLPDWRAALAAVIGVWLLVGPGSWRWAGVDGLGAYDRGAATAVALGMLTVVGSAARRHVIALRADR